MGGGALLLLACWCTGQLVRPQQSDIGWFVLIGIAGIFVGQMFAVIALKFISPLNAALSQPLQPILTAILASCLGLDALRLRTAAGAATVAGILLAVLLGRANRGWFLRIAVSGGLFFALFLWVWQFRDNPLINVLRRSWPIACTHDEQ